MPPNLRKLVTVRRVADVRPIAGADRIEIAILDGWRCIVNKDEFHGGDLALFFEIDSFLPASDARWAFLEDKFSDMDGKRGFRVKSMRMRGQISQGLLQKLSDFPEVDIIVQKTRKDQNEDEADKAIRGMAFEEQLGVIKWEQLGGGAAQRALPLSEQMSTGPLPDCIPKTDQERIQNLPDLFEDWGDKIFQETTKMDGSSMSVYFIKRESPHFVYLAELNPTGGKTGDMKTGRFGVCSRNIDLVERPGSHFWDVALKKDLPAKLEALGRNVAVQGELCGSSVQQNFEGFPAGFHDLFVFGVWDISEQRYLPPRETEQMAKGLGLKHVPVHGYTALKDIGGDMKALLERADGKGVNGKKREGIVLKHEDGEFSFKAISNSYLLKHNQ